MSKVSLPVYHVDSKRRNQKFLNGAFLPSPEDGIWCGQGVYFWTTPASARKWTIGRLKAYQNQTIQPLLTTLKATLRFDSSVLLDLTDPVVYQQLMVTAAIYAQRFDVDLDFTQTGAVINFVHDVFDRLSMPNFVVVKTTGHYFADGSGGPLSPKIRQQKQDDKQVTVRELYAIRESYFIVDRSIADECGGVD